MVSSTVPSRDDIGAVALIVAAEVSYRSEGLPGCHASDGIPCNLSTVTVNCADSPKAFLGLTDPMLEAYRWSTGMPPYDYSPQSP